MMMKTTMIRKITQRAHLLEKKIKEKKHRTNDDEDYYENKAQKLLAKEGNDYYEKKKTHSLPTY